MAFTNILPTPDYKINEAGVADSNGTAGAGFSAVKLSSSFTTMTDRTNSGRFIARSTAYQQWSIDISYNPMTLAEFRPVYAFIMQRKGGLSPFFVDLPQYSTPSDASWVTFLGSNDMQTTAQTNAASNTLEIDSAGTAYDYTLHGAPNVGEIFSISDPSNTNAYKVYMITRVENEETYETAVSANTIRLHISPPLEKTISSGATINFLNPKFRVVAADMQEYSLNTDGLYSFSLKLEEALA